MNARETEEKYALNVYPRRGLTLVRGEGPRVYDEEGNEYLDFMAQMGVVSVGYANPEVNRAINEQLQKTATVYSMFYNDVRARLMEKLGTLVPGLSKVFFCNSGAEAVEASMKLARSTTGKTEIIAANRAYHGKTLGALSATFSPKYRDAFTPLIPGIKHAPFNNYEAFAAAVTDDTAAIILEPIQGEGGVNVGDPTFFQKIRELCDNKGILLILDEVQTGLCRTGRWFAFQHFNISPDIVCAAKGIANGMPMGAVLCSDKITIPKNGHTTTFGGNPVCCAAALATLEYMEQHTLADHADQVGRYFQEQLRAIQTPNIREVRGKGLMLAIELKEKSAKYVKKLQDSGLLVVLSGNLVLRLLPPLIITRKDVDEAVEKITAALTTEQDTH